MYGELGAIKGIVDLTPEHALDEAEAFLASQGYSILRRTSTTLTAERRSSDHPAGQTVPNLTVVTMPQSEGGVQIKIRGNDVEGVQARQSEWMGWSESLPRKAEGEAGAPTEVRAAREATEVDLPPPPTVDSSTLPAPAAAADIPVPPPPQQTAVTSSPQQAETSTQRGSRGRNVLIGCLGVFGLLFLLAVAGALLAGGSGGSGGVVGNAGSGETFTRKNYGVLVANPNEHIGAKVDITGQLLDNPENQGNEVAFQMWADPVKIDWSTIVRTDRSALKFRTDDYVHVSGTVLGEMEGENAFGGTVSAVEVDADNVERVGAMAAVDPTQKTVEVGQTRSSSEGFSVTLKKVEFGMKHTRVYLTARNDGTKVAKLDFYGSKIIQNSNRVGQNDPYDYNLPKPQAGLQPGEQTEGAVIFGRADPSQPLQVSFAWRYGGFMAPKPQPLVFAVTP